MNVYEDSTRALIEACKKELEKYKQKQSNDTTGCLEIFFRAFFLEDQTAVNYVLRYIAGISNGRVDNMSIFNEIRSKPGRLANFKKNFRTYPEFIAWFRNKVKTAIRDLLRKEEPRQNNVDIDEVHSKEVAYNQDMDKTILLEQLLKTLRNKLSDDDVQLLLLRFVDGLRPSDIVERYPQKYRNPRYVSSRIYYALKQLRGDVGLMGTLGNMR